MFRDLGLRVWGPPVYKESMYENSLQDLPYGFSTAPLSNSWKIFIIWFYIALNRTANIDCY